MGLNSAKAADIAALNSRAAKEAVSRKELFSRWQETGRKFNWSRKELEKLMKKEIPKRNLEKERSAALKVALSKIIDRMSYFSKIDLIRFSAEAAIGRGLGAKEVLSFVDNALKHSPEIVPLGINKGELRYSTKEMLRIEGELITSVEKGTLDEHFLVQKESVQRILEKHPSLSEEQRLAVKHLTLEPGRVQVVSGGAGTGKSFMLGAARKCWESAGFRVLGGALAGKAAQGLYEGSGIKSDTLHRLLHSITSGALSIDSRTVFVIDEAAMVGTKQLHQVFKQVLHKGAKIVLVGDEKQLQSIEAGGAFAGIARSVGWVELKENRRQEDLWTKQAVRLFSKG
ncbi:MAG TPA: AAA family ATPase, partial [Oligoflexia bacterium]|nr:AAA family ATPase [Oligoflexia bacterium]